jgi:hypothetical protein
MGYRRSSPPYSERARERERERERVDKSLFCGTEGEEAFSHVSNGDVVCLRFALFVGERERAHEFPGLTSP